MTKLEARNSKIEASERPLRSPVRDFTDLLVWHLARERRKAVYALTCKFPPEEKFGLTSQLRRAAVSITANIAEGFGRYSYRENIQFCGTARGSACEPRDHFITAQDQGYISVEGHNAVDNLAQRVTQTLNGYIRATVERQNRKTTAKR